MNNKSKSKKSSASSADRTDCKQYELDLTDYVMGDMTFLTKEKQEKLFDHLRKCAPCRQELYDWEKTYGVMVTKQHFAEPETKKRCEELIAKIKAQVGARKIIDLKWEIGSAAGKVYRTLKDHGEISLPMLKEKTGLKEYHLQQAIGWLAGQEKISMSKDDQTAYVALSERDQKQAGV
jgi:hypothetical protein